MSFLDDIENEKSWNQSVGQWIIEILILSVIAFFVIGTIFLIYQDAVTPDVDRCKVAPEYCEWLHEYEEDYSHYEPRG